MNKNLIALCIMFIIFLLSPTIGFSEVISGSSNVNTENTEISSILSGSPIQTYSIGVYSDAACTKTLSSIDWGTIEPGTNTYRDVYLRNDGSSVGSLYTITSAWVPSNAANYIHLRWNYNEQPLSPKQVIKVTFNLSVDSNIQGITSFNFNIIIGYLETGNGDKCLTPGTVCNGASPYTEWCGNGKDNRCGSDCYYFSNPTKTTKLLGTCLANLSDPLLTPSNVEAAKTVCSKLTSKIDCIGIWPCFWTSCLYSGTIVDYNKNFTCGVTPKDSCGGISTGCYWAEYCDQNCGASTECDGIMQSKLPKCSSKGLCDNVCKNQVYDYSLDACDCADLSHIQSTCTLDKVQYETGCWMGSNNKCCYKINPNSLIWGKNTWFNTVEHSGEDCCLFGLSSISDSLGVKDYSGVVRNGIHCYNGVFYSCGDQSSWSWTTQGVKASNNQLVGSYRCCMNVENGKWIKTTCPSCSGNVKLTLSPSPCRPSENVTATVTGLSNCDGKNVDVIKASSKMCSCTVSGTGCSCQFTAPYPYGSYSYMSLIDKNGDGSYSGSSGETYSVSLAVTPSGGGCTKGCYLLAIGPYIFDVDITPIISTVSAILVIIEIVVLMTIYNRMKHTKRKRK